MTSIVPTWLPRIIGILSAWAVGEAQRRFSLTLDPAELTALMLAVYAGAHRLVSRWINPGDATKGAIIAADKAEVQAAQT